MSENFVSCPLPLSAHYSSMPTRCCCTHGSVFVRSFARVRLSTRLCLSVHLTSLSHVLFPFCKTFAFFTVFFFLLYVSERFVVGPKQNETRAALVFERIIKGLGSSIIHYFNYDYYYNQHYNNTHISKPFFTPLLLLLLLLLYVQYCTQTVC